MLKKLFEEIDLDGHVIEIGISVAFQPLNIVGPGLKTNYMGNWFLRFSCVRIIT